MEKTIYNINIEEGLPDVDGALRVLEYQFASAAAIGERVVKVIHGYGSSGRGGGRLRTAARRWAKENKRVGLIIKGEDFSIFNLSTQYLMQKFPYVAKDRDLEQANEGITILFIQ